jgi:hypothetical protein
MLTPMNIAIIGGVFVLLLLMMKMRKDRATAAKPASAQKERRSRRVKEAKAPKVKESKVKEPKGRRARRGPASIEAATYQTAATTAPEAPYMAEAQAEEPTYAHAQSYDDEPMFAEQPEATDSWVDDLDQDAPMFEDHDAQATATIPVAAPAPSWDADDVVDAPGWPAPGEMDGGWAAEGSAAAPATDDWQMDPVTAEEAAPQDDQSLAVAEVGATETVAPPAEDAAAAWTEDEGFDAAAGWGDEDQDVAPVVAEFEAVADAEVEIPSIDADDDADWASQWGSDEPSDTPEVNVVDEATPAEETVPGPPAPSADEAWDAGDWADSDDAWSAPAGEEVTDEVEAVTAEAGEWDIATEEAAAAIAPEAPVFEAEVAPEFDTNPYADDAYDVFESAPAEPEARSLDALFGFTTAPADKVEDEVEFEVVDEVKHEVEVETVNQVDIETAVEFDEEPVSVPSGRFHDPRADEPLTQWAALAPVAPTAAVATEDPASRWATIAPIAPKTPVPADPAARWAAITPITPQSGAPEKDRLDGDLTGRFALGGFAVQEGHQVVTGVTFRFAADEAPTSFAIGPCHNAPSGTLVIDIEGVLNCTAADVEVLDDPGFAPTENGFTLRLTAPAGGPFAASGTYRVV